MLLEFRDWHFAHYDVRCRLWCAGGRRKRAQLNGAPVGCCSCVELGYRGCLRYGATIGRELRAQGFNMTLGGGANLTRNPRNGRTFE